MKEELLYKCNKLSLDYFDNLMKQNVWKAFATIHSGIHHQLRIILRYKFAKNEKGEPLGNHPEKWKIIENKRFYNLVNDLFITGIITKDVKQKLLNFNSNRNKKLGHINIYEKSEISDDEIIKLCQQGLEIIKRLDKIIQNIFFTK